VAISGRHDCDLERLTPDLQRICEWQIRLFGEPAPMTLLPFPRHRRRRRLRRARTPLVDGPAVRARRPALAGMPACPKRYRTFLGLCSHEYFHTWNVKRIKPAAFTPYNLDAENYTTLLWAFEGFTSYYDDLTLLRCGVIGDQDWLETHRADDRQGLQRARAACGRRWPNRASTPGPSTTGRTRTRRTPSSATTPRARWWRWRSTSRCAPRPAAGSLDDLMRALWQRHGGGRRRRRRYPAARRRISGLDLRGFFADAVHGTSDVDLARLLRPFAIRLQRVPASRTPFVRGEDGQRGQRAAPDDGLRRRPGAGGGAGRWRPAAGDRRPAGDAGHQRAPARSAPGRRCPAAARSFAATN
jgi:predicted metalloprotease with PDZ domain